ncbi:cytochrome c oxidase assembly protein [Streptomyces sp. NPDC051207]|uniref:cytochrome c oxidase assembly protein n=1 Tax=Streptomyces sp. NPDC051207 TaxID=3154641 RepID=UPI00343C5E79
MTLAHVHPGPAGGPGTGQVLAAVAALLVTVAYLAAASRLRRRGDAWSRWRDVSFTAGGVGTAWASGGPVTGAPFTGHMIQHLVVGMAAPLLFVVARPLTLALRALGPGRARRGLLAVARSRPVGWLVLPPLAALLNVGGLWLLYRTELFAATRHQPLLHGVVHAHMLAAGLVFTFAVCQLDPVRRRWGVAVRGATLLAAGAAHAVLARTLYALPPPGTGFTPADLHSGARWMYYGGDVVDAALAVVLGVGWYTAGGRARARHHRRGAAPTRSGQSATGAAAAPGPTTPARPAGGARQGAGARGLRGAVRVAPAARKGPSAAACDDGHRCPGRRCRGAPRPRPGVETAAPTPPPGPWPP